jgi:hypothetical protein
MKCSYCGGNNFHTFLCEIPKQQEKLTNLETETSNLRKALKVANEVLDSLNDYERVRKAQTEIQEIMSK